ncbi:uncharacterized protein LOC108159375 isoform X1 [Drosophila miranda]|uniref:uncharacterized protein LOC108159375 isoform X1 n=1 Tax=Drosophila miranda TaxID=7229 RepID=UPI00143F241D|nr:uncharacterized protein LOC108159375 isoform X1 [Drosophila miranda]
MGKHKSSLQDEVLVGFMKDNPDLAKGFVKGDRVVVDAKWAELCGALNAVGPPIKDALGWKKVWADWKTNIRKKMAKNKSETRATGGGPFAQQSLGELEEIAMWPLRNGGRSRWASVWTSPRTTKEADTGVKCVMEDPIEEEPSEKDEPSEKEEPMPKRRRTRPAQTMDHNDLCAAQLDEMSAISKKISEHFERMESLEKEKLEVQKALVDKFSQILDKFAK